METNQSTVPPPKGIWYNQFITMQTYESLQGLGRKATCQDPLDWSKDFPSSAGWWSCYGPQQLCKVHHRPLVYHQQATMKRQHGGRFNSLWSNSVMTSRLQRGASVCLHVCVTVCSLCVTPRVPRAPAATCDNAIVFIETRWQWRIIHWVCILLNLSNLPPRTSIKQLDSTSLMCD